MTSNATIQDLLRDPRSFDFMAALRALQAEEDSPLIGTSLRPSDEAVRFNHEASLTFAPTAISGAAWREDKQRIDLLMRFTGLLGPNGPMPVNLTEYIIERRRHFGDSTIDAFLNIFHHRIYSLFFRAWALSQPTVDHDRADGRRHSFYLGCLIGLGTPGMAGRDSVPDSSRLFFGGWLGGLARSPDGLAAIFSDFFQVPVVVRSFQGAWMQLPVDSRCQLGKTRSTGLLGSTCFAGEQIWLAHLKFLVRFGPLTLEQYERLLPGGPAFCQVRDWIRNYVGDEFSWEAQLVLRHDAVPPCKLGGGGRLGWTTWIGSPAVGRDVDDLLVQSE